jgi:hypothetical protein
VSEEARLREHLDTLTRVAERAERDRQRAAFALQDYLAEPDPEIVALREKLRIATDALEDIIQQAEWGDDAAMSATMLADEALAQMRAVDAGER